MSTDLTPTGFAKAVLQGSKLPVTQANIAALVGWEHAEGGNWANTARYNPLNTTQPATGATSINTAGVKSYTSWQQGISATIATLHNGLYQPILTALRKGNDPGAVADAIGTSPWGTNASTVSQTIAAAAGQTYSTAPTTIPSSPTSTSPSPSSSSSKGAYDNLGGFLLKAAVTVAMVVGGLVLVAIGLRQLIAPNSRPLRDTAKVAAAA